MYAGEKPTLTEKNHKEAWQGVLQNKWIAGTASTIDHLSLYYLKVV